MTRPISRSCCAHRWGATLTDSPELAAAKRLLDAAKSDEFAFEWVASGKDGRGAVCRRASGGGTRFS
jgi:hypothetical protein